MTVGSLCHPRPCQRRDAGADEPCWGLAGRFPGHQARGSLSKSSKTRLPVCKPCGTLVCLRSQRCKGSHKRK